MRRDVRCVPRHNDWLPVIPLVVVGAVRTVLRPIRGVPGTEKGWACTISVKEELRAREGRVTDTLLHQPKVFCGRGEVVSIGKYQKLRLCRSCISKAQLHVDRLIKIARHQGDVDCLPICSRRPKLRVPGPFNFAHDSGKPLEIRAAWRVSRKDKGRGHAGCPPCRARLGEKGQLCVESPPDRCASANNRRAHWGTAHEWNLPRRPIALGSASIRLPCTHGNVQRRHVACAHVTSGVHHMQQRSRRIACHTPANSDRKLHRDRRLPDKAAPDDFVCVSGPPNAEDDLRHICAHAAAKQLHDQAASADMLLRRRSLAANGVGRSSIGRGYAHAPTRRASSRHTLGASSRLD